MLGKLLKHEWKKVWKVPTLLICILMIIAALAGLTFMLPAWDKEWIGLSLSGFAMFMVFYLALIVVSTGITIYFAVRYYKNMFTDEGYLTNTLPVSARSLLISKTITVSAWNLIASVAVVVSIIVFLGITILSLMAKDGSVAREFVEAFFDAARAVPEIMDKLYSGGLGIFCVSMILMMLATVFGDAMMIIGAVTLGQMFRKHRILGAVGAYFVIRVAKQLLYTVFVLPFMLVRMDALFYSTYMTESPFPVMTLWGLIMAGLSVATGLGLYFMSEYLIRRHLELE